ncbi:hypothetical protein ACHAPJ_005145 [Fusarium lateritium]
MSNTLDSDQIQALGNAVWGQSGNGGGGRGRRGRGGGRGRGDRVNRHITCYSCGGAGHRSRECPSRPVASRRNGLSRREHRQAILPPREQLAVPAPPEQPTPLVPQEQPAVSAPQEQPTVSAPQEQRPLPPPDEASRPVTPPGWTRFQDQSGRSYWSDGTTTQWQCPVAPAARAVAPSPIPALTPAPGLAPPPAVAPAVAPSPVVAPAPTLSPSPAPAAGISINPAAAGLFTTPPAAPSPVSTAGISINPAAAGLFTTPPAAPTPAQTAGFTISPAAAAAAGLSTAPSAAVATGLLPAATSAAPAAARAPVFTFEAGPIPVAAPAPAPAPAAAPAAAPADDDTAMEVPPDAVVVVDNTQTRHSRIRQLMGATGLNRRWAMIALNTTDWNVLRALEHFWHFRAMGAVPDDAWEANPLD